MTLITFMQEQPEFDDRYIPERVQEPVEDPIFLGHRKPDEGLVELRRQLEV
jgi:hypothetical protein